MKLNKMLVLTSIAAGSILAGSSAFAQESTTSKLGSEANNAASKASGAYKNSSMDKLSQELGLSDSQKEKVQNIFQSERQKIKDMHQNTTMSTGEKQSEYQKIRSNLDTKLQSVLTPEQYTKWQNLTHPHTPPTPGSGK